MEANWQSNDIGFEQHSHFVLPNPPKHELFLYESDHCPKYVCIIAFSVRQERMPDKI